NSPTRWNTTAQRDGTNSIDGCPTAKIVKPSAVVAAGLTRSHEQTSHEQTSHQQPSHQQPLPDPVDLDVGEAAGSQDGGGVDAVDELPDRVGRCGADGGVDVIGRRRIVGQSERLSQAHHSLPVTAQVIVADVDNPNASQRQQKDRDETGTVATTATMHQ